MAQHTTNYARINFISLILSKKLKNKKIKTGVALEVAKVAAIQNGRRTFS